MCESLEARDVPASLTWLGGYDASDDAGTSYNWSEDGGATRSALVPQPGDDLFFDGTVSSSPCDNLAALDESQNPGPLDAIHLVNGYAGTVTYAQSLATHDLELTSGTLNPGSGIVDLTVDGSFRWTPDNPDDPDHLPTINSTSELANVIITGGTTSIDPLGATLTTGSSLTFDGTESTPITTSVEPGTVEFRNVAGIALGAFVMAEVNARQASVTFTNPNDVSLYNSTITLNPGTTLQVTGPGAWNGFNMNFVNQGGTLDIGGNATANLGAIPPLGQKDRITSVTQTSGTIQLHSGSTITSLSNTVVLSGGSLVIVTDSPVGATAPALITGNLTITGGTIISFSNPSNGWTFQVDGDVNWNDGTFKPRVNAAANHQGDTWLINGVLTIGSKAVIQPQFYNDQSGINVQFRWTVIDAVKGLAPPPALAAPQQAPANDPYSLYKLPGQDPNNPNRILFQVGA